MDFRAGIHDIVLGGEFVGDFVPGGKNPLRNYVRFWTDTAVLGAEWKDRDGKPAWLLINTDPVSHQVTLPSGAPNRKVVVSALDAVVIR